MPQPLRLLRPSLLPRLFLTPTAPTDLGHSGRSAALRGRPGMQHKKISTAASLRQKRNVNMNVLSILCLLSLVLYLLIALCLTPKTEGRRLFRMLYSAAMLGGLGVLFYTVFEGMVLDYQAYILPEQNALRAGYAYLMLLIPVQIAAVVLNMVLKKKRPVLLLVLTTAISAAVEAAVIIRTYLIDRDLSNAHMQLLEFCALYLPFLFHFSVCGLIATEKKWQRVLHNLSLYLDLVVMLGFLGLIALLSYDALVQIGISGLLPLLPAAVIWILVPIVPIFVYNHFRTADLIRNGETPKGRLHFRKPGRKTEKEG